MPINSHAASGSGTEATCSVAMSSTAKAEKLTDTSSGVVGTSVSAKKLPLGRRSLVIVQELFDEALAVRALPGACRRPAIEPTR